LLKQARSFLERLEQKQPEESTESEADNNDEEDL
jgi:hypothetical protein